MACKVWYKFRLTIFTLAVVLVLLIFPSATSAFSGTPVTHCAQDAGRGFGDIDFLKNYLDPNETEDLWGKCSRASDAQQVCFQTCTDGFYASLYEANMAYVDYLRSYLDNTDNLGRFLDPDDPNYLSDYEFEQFVTYAAPPTFTLADLTVQYKDSGVCAYGIRQPGFMTSIHVVDFKSTADLYGIVVPQSFYKNYVDTVVFNYNTDCEDSDSPDILFLKNTYLPRYTQSRQDVMTELNGIRQRRSENAVSGGQNGQQKTPDGSAGITVPTASETTEALKAGISAGLDKALSDGLSSDEANKLRESVKSYQAKLPDVTAGKTVQVNFPTDSTVKSISATTTGSINNAEMAVDIAGIYGHPAIFQKPRFVYDPDYPTPEIPPVPPEYKPIEVIGLHVRNSPEVEGTPVTTPTGTEGGAGLGPENYMQDYYFTFRLPPEVVQAQASSNTGVTHPTGSKDLMIKSDSDLQNIKLLHYNYITKEWDKVPTKSVGKCDMQMCVFVAGPSSGRSYYVVVYDTTVQPPNPFSQYCCPSSAAILLLAVAVVRTNSGDSNGDQDEHHQIRVT